MPLEAGTRLGPYEIVELLGKGGMGEVYRARDTRLDRDVAVKVLPAELSEDEAFRKRFEREAKTISKLSHPNVCVLHDVGRAEGRDYLVMELLEGETLAERLARGALPADELLAIGVQIAEGLEAAHRQGLVHRDLKPGNVMLTDAGVKVLDFGLAKESAAVAGSNDTRMTTDAEPLTCEGSIPGTLPYMSPEQLEGRAADGRSDLFALGVVLFEMATGERPFSGDTHASLLACMMTSGASPLSERETSLPKHLTWVVDRCLCKDPELRWQSARDLAIGLGAVESAIAPEAPNAGRRVPRLAAGAVVLIVGLLLGIFFTGRDASDTPSLATRWTTSRLDLADGITSLALSGDGRRLAYGGPSNDDPLQIVDLQSSVSAPLLGANGKAVAFSGTGEQVWVAGSDSTLRRVSLSDGLVTEEYAGTWSGFDESGFLYYTLLDPTYDEGREGPGTAVFRQGRRRLGGEEAQSLGSGLFSPGGGLPDGKHRFGWEHEDGYPRMYLLDVASGERKHFAGRGTQLKFLEPDFLVYFHAGGLWVTRLGSDYLPVGQPRQVEFEIARTGTDIYGVFALSSGGDLVFRKSMESTPRQLVWVSRSGEELGEVSSELGGFNSPRLSPNGRQLSFSVYDGFSTYQHWRLELETKMWSRPAQPGDRNSSTLWVGTVGEEVIYLSDREGDGTKLFIEATDGSGSARRLLQEGASQVHLDVSPDGRYLIWESGLELGFWMLDLETNESVRISTEFETLSARFHPAGDWFAYTVQGEPPGGIWLRATKDLEQAIEIVEGEAKEVVWSPDGKELYYRGPTHLMSIPVTIRGDRIETGRPQELFEDGTSIMWLLGTTTGQSTPTDGFSS